MITVVNTSLFCGKAIEDKVEPITSGCYEQSVNNSVLVKKQEESLYNFFLYIFAKKRIAIELFNTTQSLIVI